MNALQRVGLVGSLVCIVVAVVGGVIVQNIGAEGGSPASTTCGLGIVGSLVSLLLVGIERIAAGKRPPYFN
jgi:hypothetical protein